MKNILRLSVLALVLIVWGCKNEKKMAEQENQPNYNFMVEGVIEAGRGAVVYLGKVGLQGTEIIATDTCDAQGKFSLEGFAYEQFPAILNFDNNKKIFLIVDSLSHIKLQIPAQQYDQYTVEGSLASADLRNLREIEVMSEREITPIRQEAQTLDPTNEKAFEALRQRLTVISEKYNKVFADSIKKSQNVLVPLFYHYMLQIPLDDEFKKVLFERAEKSGLKNEMVQAYIGQYRAEQTTAIGVMAPEINLQDPSGNFLSLSSLKGKVVLIDFWASWCGPCREENPNVVKVYQKFKDKGFEIYGVSLDDNADKWKQAIIEDGVNWFHVSDLRGWRSSAARTYAVTAIPATFLLDRNGKIVAKNLRGPELEKKIAETMID